MTMRMMETSNHSVLFDFYVAVWRRPFYLRSMYTKTRRDVSQTPFHVVDHGKRRKLGATSVEEQITPAILRHCGGISTLNNENNQGGGGGNSSNNNTVFGMAKFHASGREDMDVQMLLPPPAEIEDTANIDDDAAAAVNITGRPFCYEIYDAFQLPLPDSLASIAREVNHLDDNNATPDPRSYGRNPMGVGIAPQLQFVPSSSFKQLQAETEEKIKHYGCLCWSEQPLPATNEELMAKLGCSPSVVVVVVSFGDSAVDARARPPPPRQHAAHASRAVVPGAPCRRPLLSTAPQHRGGYLRQGVCPRRPRANHSFRQFSARMQHGHSGA